MNVLRYTSLRSIDKAEVFCRRLLIKCTRSNRLHEQRRSITSMAPAAAATHQVFNQSSPFVNIDLWKSDRTLQRAVKNMTTPTKDKNADQTQSLQQHGINCGKMESMVWANDAEAKKPILKQFDNYGRRVDVIKYESSYHNLMNLGVTSGTTSYGYNQAIGEDQLNGHIARAGLIYMQNQLEPGHCCPLVMTSACVPVFQAAARNAEKTGDAGKSAGTSASPQLWLDKLLSRQYDSSNEPLEKKSGATIGMSMTEKQGGSDVKANTTIAIPETPVQTGEGRVYSLWGHKWFTSAPMCDGFLTLAKVASSRESEGDALQQTRSTCFLVPRWKPDQERNSGFRIMRLKDKLADRANASSEVEYHGAYGQMIGEEGKGLQTILQMVQMTRLDCTLGAAGGARRALSLALNHTHGRSAFGTPLIRQPMMENVLTDLCITAEACTLSALRMAAAHARSTCGADAGLSSETIQHETSLFRVGVAIMKYFVTKQQPQFAYECMEIFGGNGFTEDFPMAKLFRHSPLNSIWEGSGNVMALDVLRASNALPSFLKEMSSDVRGQDPYFDKYCADIAKILTAMQQLSAEQQQAGEGQRYARFLVDRLAIGFQASLLLKHGNSNGASAGAFIEARIRPAVHIHVNGGNNSSFALGGSAGINYGAGAVFSAGTSKLIIEDSMPVFNESATVSASQLSLFA